MKRLIVAILVLWATTSYAGKEAITDTGEKVILNNDGTWVYANSAEKPARGIGTNKTKFSKPGTAAFLLKSTKNDTAFWIDTAKWSFVKNQENTDAEYKFQLKGKDLYAMAITEGIEIPIESLADIAFETARNSAPDAKVVAQEYRTVNDRKLIYMEINGTIKGIKFTYLGYYFSDASGSTQLVTYTASNATAKYRSDITDFLNGLVTQ